MNNAVNNLQKQFLTSNINFSNLVLIPGKKKFTKNYSYLSIHDKLTRVGLHPFWIKGEEQSGELVLNPLTSTGIDKTNGNWKCACQKHNQTVCVISKNPNLIYLSVKKGSVLLKDSFLCVSQDYKAPSSRIEKYMNMTPFLFTISKNEANRRFSKKYLNKIKKLNEDVCMNKLKSEGELILNNRAK